MCWSQHHHQDFGIKPTFSTRSAPIPARAHCKCSVCHKRKWIWNTLHRDSFTEALVYVARDKNTNVKCVNFELNSLKVYWKHSSHRRKFSYLSYFFCSFGGKSLKVNSTGTAWQALLQLHRRWLAALFLAKLCKRCFQLRPVLLILRGRILQAWHQPVKLACCLKLKQLQNCCFFFFNQGSWRRRDFAAALLPHRSASPNKRRETGKRLSPNQITALPSLQFFTNSFLEPHCCFKSALIT